MVVVAVVGGAEMLRLESVDGESGSRNEGGVGCYEERGLWLVWRDVVPTGMSRYTDRLLERDAPN